jgi:hypothetical protein
MRSRWLLMSVLSHNPGRLSRGFVDILPNKMVQLSRVSDQETGAVIREA